MKMALNSIVRNKDTSRNILLFMPPGPTALSTCRDLRTSSISVGFKAMLKKWDSVVRCLVGLFDRHQWTFVREINYYYKFSLFKI